MEILKVKQEEFSIKKEEFFFFSINLYLPAFFFITKIQNI